MCSGVLFMNGEFLLDLIFWIETKNGSKTSAKEQLCLLIFFILEFVLTVPFNSLILSYFNPWFFYFLDLQLKHLSTVVSS